MARKVPYIINDEQFNVLISHMKNKNRLACKLMYYCGLRVSEVCNLRREDMDLKKRMLYVEKSKNLQNRWVIIPSKIINDLRDFKQLDTNRKNIYNSVKRIARKMKWNISPHSLRHSYATSLMNKGMPITDVQKLLGHSHIQTTDVYLHTSLDGIKKRFSKLIDE